MSEDCKNVYVVPKRGGKLDLIAADYSVSANFCQQLGNVDEDIAYYDKSKKEIQKQRDFFFQVQKKPVNLPVYLKKKKPY